MPCNSGSAAQYANELQVNGTHQPLPLRARLTGGLLLLVFLLVNAAVVLPSLHALWHDEEHACEETQCVVLAVAQGTFESPDPAPPQSRPFTVSRDNFVPVPATPSLGVHGPPSADRAPPA